MNFPCYLFHRDYGAVRFESPEAFEAAGSEGWFDNPADASEYPEALARAQAAELASKSEPVPPVVPQPVAEVTPVYTDAHLALAEELGVKPEAILAEDVEALSAPVTQPKLAEAVIRTEAEVK